MIVGTTPGPATTGTYRSRFLLCSRKVPCGHSMRRHSVQIHNSIPNSDCKPAYCRFEAAPLGSVRTCWLSAVAVARCRTHDPAAGRRPLSRLSASAGFLPQRAIVHQLGRRQARHRDLVETPSRAAAAQRFPLRRSLPYSPDALRPSGRLRLPPAPAGRRGFYLVVQVSFQPGARTCFSVKVSVASLGGNT